MALQTRCIDSTKKEETMSKSNLAPTNELMRLHDVLAAFPVSRSAWYAGVKLGMYPQAVRLGKRTVAWRASEIDGVIKALNPTKLS